MTLNAIVRSLNTFYQRAGKKVAYHVECKEADLFEICQDWQTAAQWTVENDQSPAGMMCTSWMRKMFVLLLFNFRGESVNGA